MKHKLIIGTKNKTKINQIKSALDPLNIEVVGLESLDNLPVIIEDGETAQENAKKKATTYAKHFEATVLSMDNALYFNDLKPEDQPGTHIRRVGNQKEELNDSDLLDYYHNLISKLGDEVKAYWEFAICIAEPNGNIYETTIILKRIFTINRGKQVMNGYPLESIQIDPESKKHISDMTESEVDIFWKKKIGAPLQEFVKKSFNIE